ncbi:Aspartyl protease family protein [Quillaja saponaria]|uniref:Aspartyl protease family protein n=1 Tax=Quillaja saponaria TaxID=32244 RepID=A0AAD7L6Y5_QUISA|nr:Aspartyl protease family protein [Quillaja saponaria]
MGEATAQLPMFLSIVLLYLLIVNGVQCLEDKKVLNLQNLQWHHPTGGLSCLFQKSRQTNGAIIMEMKHRDNCQGNIIDWNSKLEKQLIWDETHVRSMQQRIGKMVSKSIDDDSETRIPLNSGIKYQILNYVVTMELGGQNMTLIVDTGSDLTWVQCQPCKSCYNQQGPLFKPSTSPSYQPILCNSSTCQSLQFATGNSGVCGSNPPTCKYVVNYGDGSYTNGELGAEKLGFGTTSINKFVFGCGRNNKGLFGGASGLMGLGRSDLSMVFQTSAIFGGVFSYCLPSTEAGASGSLVLGNGDSSVFKNVTPISYTRMVPNPQLSTFYVLNLTGISIGGVALHGPSFGNKGNLIDSGTVITRLAPSVYKALKTEFLNQFSGFPSAPGFSILDTCFNLTGYEEVNIPTISMYFEGDAELKVDLTGVFYFVKTDASQVCLALASLSDEYEIGIIGNYPAKESKGNI